MSELFQSGQHPDADQLSAFAEDALPAHEREQTLAHLAGCEHCRTIVSLSLPEVEEAPEPIAVRRPWFYRWNLVCPVAATAAAVIAFTIHLHKAAPVYAPVQVADVNPPAPPVTPTSPSQPTAAPKAATHVETKSNFAKPPATRGDTLALQDPGGVIDNRSVIDLPINGRNTMALNQQSVPLAINGNLHGSSMGQAAKAGNAAAPIQPVTTVDGVAIALNKPMPSAAPRSFNSNPSFAVAAPSPPPAVSAKAAEVSAAGMEFETTNAATSATITPSIIQKLPSGLPITSTIARVNETLALDTAGALFLSIDGGRHWKAISTQWPGRAVKVELTSLSTRTRQSFGVVSADKQAAPDSMGRATTSNSALTGTVTDASGAIIPGASIIVTQPLTSASRTVKTDGSGRYTIAGLAPGGYQIEAAAPGFQVTREAHYVAPSQQSVVNLSLAVGQTSETVTVQSDAATVNIESAKTMKKSAKISPPNELATDFQIITDTGERWTSTDGLTWNRK